MDPHRGGDRARVGALAVHALRRHDAERSRVARELQDSAAQTIAALGFGLSAAARAAVERADHQTASQLGALHALATAALEELRVLAGALHPRALEEVGLDAALGWLARRARETSGLEVIVAVDRRLPRLGTEVAATLFEVAREAVENVERHAGAATAWITVCADGGAIHLEVRDLGAGFDLSQAEARRHAVGLLGSRERVAYAGGTLVIDTAPGHGTRVRASLPLAG